MEQEISYAVSFGAGFLTFLSPCFLPLVPSYIVYLSGISLDDMTGQKSRQSVRARVLVHGALFSAGFSAIFILLGLTATFIGRFLIQYQHIIRIAGGVLIILFGLAITGVFQPEILLKERRFAFRKTGVSYLGSFLIGVTFAAAWTPCAGPILGTILVFAGSKADMMLGAKLLSVYSLGIAVPFILSSLVIGSFASYLKKAERAIHAIKIGGGIAIILIGVLVVTGYMQRIAFLFEKVFSK